MALQWYSWWKEGLPFDESSYSYTYMDLPFCSTQGYFSHGYNWPSGSYCIFRKGGSCPSGQFHDEK